MTRRTAGVLIVALVLLQGLPALLQPAEFIQDDSYFYLVIARNIVAGHGSTFHGLSPTNGYHPLWMAGAVLAAAVAPEPTRLLQVVVAIQIVLALLSALLLARLLRRMQLDGVVLGACVLLAYLLGTGVYASEAHLNALTLCAALLVFWRALDQRAPRPWFVAGIAFGFALLARLDNVFVAGSLMVFGVLPHVRTDTWGALRRGVAVACGAGLVIAPYLVYNAVQFGHLVPISGAIKSTFPSFDLDLGRLGPVGQLAAASGLLATLTGLFVDREPQRRPVWLGLGIGTLLHALYVAGFTDHYTFWAWYYVNGVVAAALCAAFWPAWVSARLGIAKPQPFARNLSLLLAVVLLTAGTARAGLKAFNPLQLGPWRVDIPVNEYRWPEEFARWLHDHLPPDDVVFVYDWPGALAYYSGLHIVPMDGLVSDYRYSDDLLAEGPLAYLCARHVGHYFGLVDERQSTTQVEIRTPLGRRVAGELEFANADAETLVREVVTSPSEALPFALWRLPCEAGR